MKKVKVLFSTPKKFNLVSFLLKTKIFGMGTPFSHTCIELRLDRYDRSLIYEASGSGVIATEASNWRSKNKVIFEYDLEMSEENKKRIIAYSIDNLGIKYGYPTLAFLFIRDKFGLTISSGIDGNKSLICSEFAYLILKEEIDRMYKEINRVLPPNMDEVHPRELYQAFLEASVELQKKSKGVIS